MGKTWFGVWIGFVLSVLGLFAAAGCTAGSANATVTASQQPISINAVATGVVPPTATVVMGRVVPVGTIILVPGVVPTSTIQASPPRPSPSVQSTDRTLTLDDNGKTIEIAFAHSFLLALDPNWDWKVAVANPDVVKQDANGSQVPGTQGVFWANSPNRTRITAVGEPVCRKAQPTCDAPNRLFEVDIVVQYSK